MYSKPTDSHLYLPPSNSHPKHVFKASPFGVALRLRRNGSEDEFFTRKCVEYKNYLVNQGYPANLVNDQFSKVLSIPRRDLLKQKARASKRLLPFVTDYNPNLPNINYIIRKHLHLLESNTKLKELFPKNSIIPAYRRSKNLKEILAPSKYQARNIHTTNPLDGGCYKCDKSRCDLCKNYFVESRNFCSFRTGKSYIVRPNLTCSSKNVIYLASCNKCQLQYIGSTTTEFKVRFRNHKSSMITNKKSCEVAVHFNSILHSLQDFSFQCIDQINDTNERDGIDKLLITKEAYWSAQLFTLAPYGLNERQEFHSKNRIHFNSI